MKKLMILGTFHMESKADLINTENTEMLQHTRFQEEFEIITDKLAEYNPTKIFVEIEKTQQQSLDKAYEAYLAGKVKSTGELYQIAFRLAKKTGTKVYAIDWMEQGAAIRPISDVFDYMDQEPAIKREIEQYNPCEVSLDWSISKNLRLLNSREETEKSKAYYTNYARLGVSEYYGMGWLIWWYQRNLNIFANISDLLEADDRGLLLIGAAHKGILEEIFQDSKSVEIIDSLKYIDH